MKFSENTVLLAALLATTVSTVSAAPHRARQDEATPSTDAAAKPNGVLDAPAALESLKSIVATAGNGTAGAAGAGAAADGDDIKPADGLKWIQNVPYERGNTVIFDGMVWKAKWWTSNDQPGGAAGVWVPVGKAEGGDGSDGTAVGSSSPSASPSASSPGSSPGSDEEPDEEGDMPPSKSAGGPGASASPSSSDDPDGPDTSATPSSADGDPDAGATPSPADSANDPEESGDGDEGDEPEPSASGSAAPPDASGDADKEPDSGDADEPDSGDNSEDPPAKRWFGLKRAMKEMDLD